MKNNLTKLVRVYMIFGSVYLGLESLIHFSNLRLLDIYSTWPKEVATFSSWMSIFYASLAAFLSILLLVLQSDLEKNRATIKLVSLYGIFHGSLLIFASFTVSFDQIYTLHPSLGFWLPSYNSFIFVEAVLLYVFAALVYLWQKRN